MSIRNLELTDGIILKEDIYKDNVLLLKKGVILNAYLINKLNKFGLSIKETDNPNEIKQNKSDFLQNDIKSTALKVLIIQNNELKARKNKDILLHAGYNNNEIAILNNLNNPELRNWKISCVFVDSKLFDQDFIDSVLLLSNKTKLSIFVLDCDEYKPQNVNYNSEYIKVNFLHKPLATNYIKALLQLYS